MSTTPDRFPQLRKDVDEVLREFQMPAYSSLAMSRLMEAFEKELARRLAPLPQVACKNCPFWKHVHYDDGHGNLIAPGCPGFVEV